MGNHLTKSVLLMGVLACALLAGSAQANRSVYLVVGNDNPLSAGDQIVKDRFETAYGSVDVTVVLDENANWSTT